MDRTILFRIDLLAAIGWQYGPSGVEIQELMKRPPFGRERLTRHRIYTNLSDLEDEGLVEIEGEAGQEKSYTLTDAGHEVLKQRKEIIDGALTMNVTINTEDGTEEFREVVNVSTVPNEDSTTELAYGEEVPTRPHALEMEFSDGSVEAHPRAWDLRSVEPRDGKDWALYTRFISEDGDYEVYDDVVALHTVPLDEELGDYTGDTDGPPLPPHAVELKLENGETVRVPNDWDLTQAYINVETGVGHAR